MPKKKNTARNVIITIIIILITLYLVYKMPLQGEVPEDMINKARELDEMSKDKLELVKNVYDFINQSYTSPIRQYLIEPKKIFIKDKQTIWNLRGRYMPSYQQNLMAKEMLLATGKFDEKDFELRSGWCEISPHSVLFVNIDGKKVAIDTWFADNFGEFNCYTFRPCGEKQKVCL